MRTCFKRAVIYRENSYFAVKVEGCIKDHSFKNIHRAFNKSLALTLLLKSYFSKIG